MTVGAACVREVDTARPEESVQVAAQRMLSRNVGTLVVQDASNSPIGIVTDRDLAVRVLAKARDPFQTTIGEIMSRCPETVAESASLEEALTLMRKGPYRRLPVVDAQGTLAGLLSLDDILEQLTDEFRKIGQLLEKESPASLARM